MGTDNWNTWLLRVREQTEKTGAKCLFPEMLGNDFQRKDQVLEKMEGLFVWQEEHPQNTDVWDWHIVHCGGKVWWLGRGQWSHCTRCQKAKRDECWYSKIGFLLFLFSVLSRTPIHGMDHLDSKCVPPSVKPPWKHPQEHTQRCFSLVIPSPVRIVGGED